jgi:hypothetical protein
VTAGPFVVIMTGGALPRDNERDPRPDDIEEALKRAGVLPAAVGDAALARIIAGEAFKAGWHAAARDHRVVTAWVIEESEDAAERFAAVIRETVGPAYVIGQPGSALGQLLFTCENMSGRVIA